MEVEEIDDCWKDERTITNNSVLPFCSKNSLEKMETEEITDNNKAVVVATPPTKKEVELVIKPGVAKILAAFGVKKKEKPKEEFQHSAKKDAFLLDACSQGSIDLVRNLITLNGCSPNLKDGTGKSLVQLAMEGGHEHIVLYLFIEQKALLPVAVGLRTNIGRMGSTTSLKLPKLHPSTALSSNSSSSNSESNNAEGDIFHISLLRTAVIKTSDKEKGFQLACEAISHSSNATISALLLAEMYSEIAKKQPTHRHVLEANSEILQKVSCTFLDFAKPEHVVEVLGGRDPSFGGESPLTVAIRSHNSLFISHPLVQDFVQQIWKGEDPLRVSFDDSGGGNNGGNVFWDFVMKPKDFFKSPRGHFFLHIYMYLIFIGEFFFLHYNLRIFLSRRTKLLSIFWSG